jgi:prepilin-type N-terminal cleavage/methylation domain-containing protein/prepilin-type processing-associated H-X9-DG protein
MVPPRKFFSSGAFTIIELLVVIAIIAMLAALLVPSIQTGAQKAKGVKCLSNLRQVGICVQQYMADPENGHRFPPIYNVGAAYNSNAMANANISSASSLQPLACLSNYGATMAMLTCPSDTSPDADYGSYLWSPVLQDEQPEDVHIYSRGGVFTVSKLSTLTVCTDKGMPHLGKLNVLRADGHVETKP